MLRPKSVVVGVPALLAILIFTLVVARQGPVHVAAQQIEVALHQEGFDGGSASDWEMELGWRLSKGALLGERHQ